MTDAHRQPESAIAQSFSASLDSVFGLDEDEGVQGLSRTVEEKKRNVSSQSEELAAIESRLRATEERLARVASSERSTPRDGQAQQSATMAPQRQQQGGASVVAGALEDQNRRTNTGAGLGAENDPATAQASLSQTRPQGSREDSLGLGPMPGAMPRTPY